MKVTKNIDIYLIGKRPVRVIDVVQYDTGVQLVFTVKDFTIPSGATGTLYVQKPSGKFVYQQKNITIANNTITINLENQALTEYGKTPYQVTVSSGSDAITTFTGLMMVERSLKDAGAVESRTVIKAFDEVTAERIAEFQTNAETIANALIATIPDDYTELTAKVNESANAIKGNLSGAVVSADDVSPVEHLMNVKAKSKNRFNTASYKTEKDYSNNKMIYAISAENLIIGRTYTVFSKVPLQWFKISNSATGYSCAGLQNDNVGFTSYTFTHQRHTNIPESALLYIYVNNLEKTAMYDMSIMENMGICIVEENESTEYLPYVDPSTVKVTRCGKNMFDIGTTADYHTISEYTVVENGVIKGYVNSSNAGHCINLTNKYMNGKYAISFKYSDTMPRLLIRLYNNSGEIMTACSELTSIGFQYNDSYKAFFANTKAISVNIPNAVAYWCLGFVFPITNTANNGDIVQVSNIQVEAGETVTAFEPYNGIEYIPTSDGVVSGVTSISPNMTILTDTEGVIVECEYNKDTNKVIKKITDALDITI